MRSRGGPAADVRQKQARRLERLHHRVDSVVSGCQPPAESVDTALLVEQAKQEGKFTRIEKVGKATLERRRPRGQ